MLTTGILKQLEPLLNHFLVIAGIFTVSKENDSEFAQLFSLIDNKVLEPLKDLREVGGPTCSEPVDEARVVSQIVSLVYLIYSVVVEDRNEAFKGLLIQLVIQDTVSNCLGPVAYRVHGSASHAA